MMLRSFVPTHLSLGVFSLVLALGATACTSTVIGGGGGVGGDDTSSSNSGSAACAPNCGGDEEPATAIAILDPNTLYLKISNQGLLCSEPNIEFECGPDVAWEVSISIPPALQKVGVIPLSDTSLISYFSDSGPNIDAPQDCWGGGGSFIDGTLEITNIDATSVSFTLSNTTSFDFNADGSYVAPLCP